MAISCSSIFSRRSGRSCKSRSWPICACSTGEAEFSFGDDRTSITGLRLETPDLQFETKGTVKYDGKMSLNAQLAVSEKVAQQLPTFVRSNFSPPDEKGRQSIALRHHRADG